MSLSANFEEANVTLEVDGEKFHCNRNELATQSSYFEAMFSDNFVERHKDVIKIQNVDASAMRFLLEWISDTSKIDSLRGEEVLAVLQAAAMLRFERLQRTCEDVMVQRWLSPESCLQTAATADQLSLMKLQQKASALALWHFSEVRHTQAFLNLRSDALVEYLTQDALSLGSNSDEFQVFEAVSCWVEHNMLERHPETLEVLSCVRMNFIPTNDIQSMLNYACIDSCKDAQMLLKCIIHVKEGKEVSTIEESAVQEKSLNGLDDNKACCETIRKIADHIKACTSAAPSEVGSIEIMEKDVELKKNSDNMSINEFSANILVKAQVILSQNKRQLPTVACMIGHIMIDEEQMAVDEEKNDVEWSHIKKNRKEKTKNGSPFIFYWDSDKNDRPVPLLPLTKVKEGPFEPLGYTVISRGQELFVIGGEYVLGYGHWNKSVWKYDVWSETWTFETSLTEPRRHHSVVCLDDNLYIIGGFGKFRVIMDSMDRYHLHTRTWHKCVPLPTNARINTYSTATCVHKNLIYVISCMVFCYYPTTDSWATLTDITIPPSSSFNSAMSHGGLIYLTGRYSSDLMCFDPLVEKTIKCIGSFQNNAVDACLAGNMIYSFSEEDERPCVEVYDIAAGIFKVLWKGNPSDEKISFKKSRGCFPLVLYRT